MKTDIGALRDSFTRQADGFEAKGYHLGKKEHIDHLVRLTGPSSSDQVLEVAAGTCLCARAFAPLSGHVTCLDAVPAMLETGRRESMNAGLGNMSFVLGEAESLPFEDGTFDIVFSRLAFHHFASPYKPFEEMRRVLRKGGKLVLSDMTVHDDSLRDEVDRIERLRDPSHTHNLTLSEMRGLYEGMDFRAQEVTDIAVGLESWMALTGTPEGTRSVIRKEMEKGSSTGLRPFRKDGKVFFLQPWAVNIGIKL